MRKRILLGTARVSRALDNQSFVTFTDSLKSLKSLRDCAVVSCAGRRRRRQRRPPPLLGREEATRKGRALADSEGRAFEPCWLGKGGLCTARGAPRRRAGVAAHGRPGQPNAASSEPSSESNLEAQPAVAARRPSCCCASAGREARGVPRRQRHPARRPQRPQGAAGRRRRGGVRWRGAVLPLRTRITLSGDRQLILYIYIYIYIYIY